MRDTKATLEKFIDAQKFCILGTLDGAGYPVQRALLPPRKREGIKTFWFSTNTSSHKVAEARQNPKCSLYFCDRGSFKGLMLRGTLQVLEDAESRHALWQDGDTMYYPAGVDDPDYCVLRFTAEDGRFYANLTASDIVVE